MKFSNLALGFGLSLFAAGSLSFAQESFSEVAPAVDSQCRVQAKSVAVQTYQTCVSDIRASQVEQIRQEYQDKIAQLKSDYEARILELQAAIQASETEMKPESALSEELVPVVPVAEVPSETIRSEDLTISEPTITLRPANQKAVATKPSALASKSSKALKKGASQSNTKALANPVAKPAAKSAAKPIVAQNRPQGQKGVKGIAKTLPAKQKSKSANVTLVKPAVAAELTKPVTAQIQSTPDQAVVEIAKSGPEERLEQDLRNSEVIESTSLSEQ